MITGVALVGGIKLKITELVFSFPGESNEIIESAMQEIQQKTCVKFVERSNEKNWLKFVKKSGFVDHEFSH